MLTFSLTQQLEDAKLSLEQGQIIAFPTETVYALAVDATNSQAVSKLYKLKNRDKNKPMQVMFSSIIAAEKHLGFSEKSKKIVNKFWPGALTIILSKKSGSKITNELCGSKNTIGARVPDHKIASSILNYINFPLATTSANYAGEEPYVKASEIRKKMQNNISIIFENNYKFSNIASTVIDMSDDKPKILRQGSITLKDIKCYLDK